MKTKPTFAGYLIVAALLISAIFSVARADQASDLTNQINNKKAEIAQINAKIEALNKVIAVTQSEKQSLAREIKTLEDARKKLQMEIVLTEKKISTTSLFINKLGSDIRTTEQEIGARKQTIGNIFRQINTEEGRNLIDILSSTETTSTFWSRLGRYNSLNIKLKDNIDILRGTKIKLEDQKGQKETEKKNLTDLKNQLTDQKILADSQKAAKDQLLKETKNKEASYQKMLSDNLKRKNQVESEINNIEAAIKIALDPTKFPKAGNTVLNWPLKKFTLTQYFGNTDFATRNPQIYKGKGHNGIDMAAPIGTPLLAPANGTIIGTGDTDKTCKGASYGKWILLRHDNGLSTIYGHLSLVKAKEGERVSSGEVIGYTGKTGYSTGPHLHFSVVATQGVQVSYLKSKVAGCGTYRMPIAALESYLNPLSYLPEL